MRSASLIVDNRWATTIRVAASSCRLRVTTAWVRLSNALVASSKMSSLGRLTSALEVAVAPALSRCGLQRPVRGSPHPLDDGPDGQSRRPGPAPDPGDPGPMSTQDRLRSLGSHQAAVPAQDSGRGDQAVPAQNRG
jgi:hypothetical protein